MSAEDAQVRFHEQWLGLAQPYEGLVFSVPVLAEAQIMPEAGAELTARFRAALVHHAEDAPGRLGDLRAFFEAFLGYSQPGALVPRDALPAELHFYAQEGRQDVRPSFAIARSRAAPADDDPFADFGGDSEPQGSTDPDASPYLALVWDLRDDAGPLDPDTPPLDLDRPEDRTGPWRYPPTAKLERLLREAGVPIGLLCNGEDLRLVYAPAGESTSHLTFRGADMQRPDGRPLLAAFELLLGAARSYGAAPEYTLEGLLKESRSRQADVTKDLAAQVFEAVELLLAGFETAAQRDSAAHGAHDWLRAALEAPHDHLYQGVLSVVLRLVFLLYAEDQSLLPVGHPTYARHLSVKGLYDELVEDAGMHPESMHHRFGAYGRLLSLFRAMFLGVEHGDLRLPPRRGKLFDPSSFPFLEGGLPGSTAAIVAPESRAEVRPPSVDDGTLYEVLSRLMLFEGQRLSYAALDVEQIGSVYESLMGYHVLRLESPAVRLRGNGVWAEASFLRGQKPTDRKKWLKEVAGLSAAQIKKVEAALNAHEDDQALSEAFNAELSPGKKAERPRHRAPVGKLVLQPGEERRRSGSHYTPRSLTERIVRRTLEPLLKCLGDAPTEAQILALRICDPAMGSGAFLVEVTRQLAQHLLDVWTREGRAAALSEEHDDALLHARRLVVQRCVYGVDKNAAAVELAKLSLWLVTLSKELPFTFVDHALRHGDSLVGLDLDQVSSFHWKAGKQVPLFKQVLEDALDQALEHRGELLELAKREDSRSQQEKRRLLDHADHAIDRIRVVADACVGAFFAEAKDKAREAERKRRMDVVQRWLSGDGSLEAEVRGWAEAIREQHAPFHWWLEFPEVFYEERPDPLCGGEVNGAAFMEGFVGNPPFMGRSQISAELGDGYKDWLVLVHTGANSNADLCAHFFRRTASLLGAHGVLALVATNTVSQGDTREAALKPMLANGWVIYDAVVSMPWPGSAAVTVSVVHMGTGELGSRPRSALNGETVEVINSRLRPKPERMDAKTLVSMASHSCLGAKIYGQGFLVTPAERDSLVAQDPANDERLRPYLGGEEVNSSPSHGFDRYVIDFGTRELQECRAWPDLLQMVEERVLPARMRVRDNAEGRQLKRLWWQFFRPQAALYAALAPLDRCLVTACHSKHLLFSIQPTDRIFSHGLYVFPLPTHTAFAVLQSRIHEPWAWLLSSTMRNAGIRYAASDCFDTFPFPKPDPRTVLPEVEAAGEAVYEARARFMVETNQGLTKTYNALKRDSAAKLPEGVSTPAEREAYEARLAELRTLHEAMDRAVLRAYGWNDLAEQVPPFAPETPEERAALEAFNDEVIDRLYVLNAERAREEERLGLRGKKGKGKGAKAPAKRKDQDPGPPTLPGLDDEPGK